jgi:hypothetical protein
VPDTLLAWLLQSAAFVQRRLHVGYPEWPEAHEAHVAWLKLEAHVAHDDPVQDALHVQLHPVVRSPLTLLAWLLQSAAIVQTPPQVG